VSAAGVWYYLEVEAFVHDTTGFVRVYRDGVLLVAAENQDTRGQAGSDLVEMIRFIGNNGGGTSDGPNVWSIDDIYVSTPAPASGSAGSAHSCPMPTPPLPVNRSSLHARAGAMTGAVPDGVTPAARPCVGLPRSAPGLPRA
jgi:hypothetical protein